MNDRKYSFKDDYSEGVHPLILEAIAKTNYLQLQGYGEDEISKEAKERIKQIIQTKSDIHFLSGGTQTNLTALSVMLKPYESIMAANTSHISTHECGAIEHAGHKIHNIISNDGKISPAEIQKILDEHSSEHMVKPKVVFISDSTEFGTIYSKKELENLYTFCKKNSLYLYIDGARIGSALTSKYNDIDLKTIANMCDMFYIGGTKNGAMFGEALIITNELFKENFRYILKQNGALLAKGRFLGIQFNELFRDNLFFKLAKHTNKMAYLLEENILQKGYDFYVKPQTNQLFPVFPNELIQKLQRYFDFYIWQKYDDKSSVVRIVTSWTTKKETVEKFINLL